MCAATATVQRAFPDFRFVDPIQSTTLSGFPAAYRKAAYTVRTAAGRAFPILARSWVVPRGASMFLIGMSGAADGDDTSEEAFTSALASIRILR
jgi:hypothetical protein